MYVNNKIVFFDIDGTLVDHNKDIPRETVRAIELLKECGIYVAIATGRAPFMFEDIRKKLAIESFVSFNGQYVVFEGETVYEHPITKTNLVTLYKQATSGGHPMVFMTNNDMKASIEGHPDIKNSLASLKFHYPEVDPDFLHKTTIYQALLFCKDKEEASYVNASEQLRFIRWHDYSCDVLPNGGSKAVGVEKLIEASGLKVEDSYAFGDGLNDLEMIKHVGTGIAMGNAIEELKQIADYVTDDVDNGGIVKGLRHLGLLTK
ncbi:Cof-type HAD-IIB family hydrolase [Aquibacillus sp. 3ASR75-11]|uniref:Cof-type HAD-IIB family hydrolase n=1 Tax=Terrihalobacillus insolitus TaxID=2950438 RepID=A0A9X3WSB0_9BACI|nr:Cof-type HAD-IIB family hydrolase [Terrihalobacillus insolitus]MDC3412770.1 Cof-type HAD-IIB family hydrolase [Terrihalobacillus insolitus]MDC3423753.1 Cof-type HAD-IIB family hydrolase [Terrihalobacillus insolitus]